MNEANKALQEASGRVSVPASDWVTNLMYYLLRDCASAGDVEEVVRKLEVECRAAPDTEAVFCNGWLAQYAKHLGDRLWKLNRPFRKPPTSAKEMVSCQNMTGPVGTLFRVGDDGELHELVGDKESR